ncbi:hypothetical protein GCM10011344_29190 [Dokdonia pacifica]|uniref:N-acetyltransferase domain-containing protein n=1 Tax=Dokdonia pacifica TaxID=1627892 RepID=A0A239C6U1_9FLAO|nr:hypothetical protein [Dokdonia pacifica]GGG26590.1 hypothetical protein GCM10011344_29190 [Dokdonia pacifica]SNS15093.1 hypothetical protein SAMN06265376_107124 [Dokdonia pacifica]
MIYSIQPHNKIIALEVLRKSMIENPNLLWMTGACKKRLYNLYSFCIRFAMLYKGAYLHSDTKGVLLFYKRGGRSTLSDVMKKIGVYSFFISSVVDIFKIPRICRLQQLIKKKTPNIPHLYCLIIAVSPEEKSTQTIIQLRDFLFEQSEKQQLPIYIQTSVRRNKILFERYGFECYDSVVNTSGDYTLWLLKRDYEKRNATT